MKPFILILLLIIPLKGFPTKNLCSKCTVCGEYFGGREFFSWNNLKLKPNGKYEYTESRHTMQTRFDKGIWTLENEILILNSSLKSRWKSPNKHNQRKNYFFKNQQCEIKGNSILIRKEENESFNFAYYSLRKTADWKPLNVILSDAINLAVFFEINSKYNFAEIIKSFIHFIYRINDLKIQSKIITHDF